MSDAWPRTLFITTDAVGGVWSYSVALVRGMSRQGWRCTLAVLGPPPSEAQRREVAGLPGCTVLATGLALEWTLTSRAALDRLVSDLAVMGTNVRATSVHLHAPALAAGAWHVPVVAVAHSCMATWWDAVRGGPRPDEIGWHVDATSRGLTAADVVIAPSRAFAEALERSYGVGRDIRVVYNGVDAAASEPTARRDVVIAAGRLWDEAKGMALLDSAAARMRTPVHVAGPLHAPGAAPATFGHLRHLGNLAPLALKDAMSRAAVYAAPACYEPFGLAVLEAAQREMPLVLADIPTFRELWSDAAIFLPGEDAHAWASTLDSLVQDEASRHALGRAALTRAGRYTAAAMVSATAAIHHEVGRADARAA